MNMLSINHLELQKDHPILARVFHGIVQEMKIDPMDSNWGGGQWTGSDWTGGQWTGGDWTGGQWTGGDWNGGQWSGDWAGERS